MFIGVFSLLFYCFFTLQLPRGDWVYLKLRAKIQQKDEKTRSDKVVQNDSATNTFDISNIAANCALYSAGCINQSLHCDARGYYIHGHLEFYKTNVSQTIEIK